MEGIIEALDRIGGVKTFIKLIQMTGLDDTLNTEGPFTVFAPNDEAFSELPEKTTAELLANRDALTDVLNYHITPGELTSDDLDSNPSVQTLEGEDILIDILDDTIEVNDAAIIKPDISYNNGWIQVIDSVLMP